MLALTRKKGESIIIADNITITVLSISGDVVKLGIDAPRHIPVNRQEIFQQILEQNKEAVCSSTAAVTDLARLMIKKRTE
jgi:carbon storage regulator